MIRVSISAIHVLRARADGSTYVEDTTPRFVCEGLDEDEPEVEDDGPGFEPGTADRTAVIRLGGGEGSRSTSQRRL